MKTSLVKNVVIGQKKIPENSELVVGSNEQAVTFERAMIILYIYFKLYSKLNCMKII